MSFASRGTRAAARPLRQSQTPLRQSTRRSASSHDAHHDHAGHGESAHHAEVGGTGNESWGKGFYITLGAIPLLYLTYNLSSSKDNVVERWYRSYESGLKKKEAQDVLHTKALEQAIADRAVLYGNKTNHSVQLRNQEMFNVGSPWNVAAGQGTADLSKLREHYEASRQKLENDRVDRLKASQ